MMTWKPFAMDECTIGNLLAALRLAIRSSSRWAKFACLALGLTAGTSSANQVWDGQISDSICAKNHNVAKQEASNRNMPDAECVLRCVRERHANYVFVFHGKVYDIANQYAAGLEESAGLFVRVIGSLSAGAITVSRIEVPGPVTTTFFAGGLERISRKSIERVESRFIYPPSQPSGPNPSSVVDSDGYVSRETMALHLADGISIDALLPETPGLSAESIGAQHNFGDQVAVTCHFLQAPVFDFHHGYEILEVESIRSLRPATKEELAQIIASHPFGFAAGDNLLHGAPSWIRPDFHAPSPQETSARNQPALERVRAVNLAYPAEMPNFIAHEIARTYTSRKARTTQWKLQYTVDSEITVRGGGETRRNVRKNGKPWNELWLPDFLRYGAWFGLGVRQLFDPHCPNTFEPAGTEEVRGKPMLAFRVTSAGGCFSIGTGYETFKPAITGRVLVENSGGRLVLFEYEAEGFPAEFPLAHWKWATAWDDVRIGDASYLVPVRSELVAVYSDAVPQMDQMTRVAREYKDYRHFEASSAITFH